MGKQHTSIKVLLLIGMICMSYHIHADHPIQVIHKSQGICFYY